MVKRKWDDKSAVFPSSSETLTYHTAQDLIRRLSNVTYEEVAPHVGLDPDLELQGIGIFEIHRSRILTDLFKSIVVDMDVMMV